MIITIPGALPPLGKLMRMHWAKRNRINNDWTLEISCQTERCKLRKTEKRLVKIMVYHKTRRFDEDNLHGAVKGIIDALRKTNWIYNDSPRWLDLKLDQAIDHENPRVEIRIEEA
jgi:Holliday junction resolvase RusA-like endonuclease